MREGMNKIQQVPGKAILYILYVFALVRQPLCLVCLLVCPPQGAGYFTLAALVKGSLLAARVNK